MPIKKAHRGPGHKRLAKDSIDRCMPRIDDGPARPAIRASRAAHRTPAHHALHARTPHVAHRTPRI
ncbi:hypothetical protein, partial [Streptomyces sp. SID10115]|uniref:hypothetical protein n=1 Tax=Streptomyces sp. SID10115 TaxID=2706016 RepID=UPI0019D20FA9